MSPIMSIYLFCFQQLPVSIDMLSAILFYQSSSLQNKFSALYYLSWGYLTFCSNQPHFGHRVNYHISKPIAEHILKYNEFLFTRNTIYETAGTHFAKKVSFYKKQNLDLNFILFLIWGVKCSLKAKKAD